MSRIDDRWPEIDAILDAALDVPPAERAGYVARACGDDAELREIVERVLGHSTADAPPPSDGPLWDALAADLAAGAVTPPRTPSGDPAPDVTPPPTPARGTVIDRYRLLEEIGRGGMSIVFRAERTDGAFDAPVALKLATLGGIDENARARFLRERQILAQLRHPHVAQILDGGETELGQPYLVMELVDGEPIDVFADRHVLSVEQRLALFVDVVHAVEHAHRNLVVHRDIKPSNVLVDRERRVKLLDFGIAALLGDTGGDVTRTHLRPMTPAFASPEQLRGESVTTLSDVYQLGHLLYRLLTGCPPYRPATQDTDAWRRAVTETDPARPSTVVNDEAIRERLAPEGRAITEIARLRGTTSRNLSRQLAGDLETIVLMALRKEPERRYASALQLAEDLERYRQGLPVRAQADTAGYRLRKFVARNRVAVAAATLALLVLIAFTTTVALQSRVISAERDRARREAETAGGVTRFLLDIFQDSAPVAGSTVDVRALDVVDRAAARIESDLRDDPVVRARVMAAIGGLYNRFGQEDKGRTLLREAVSVLERDKTSNGVPWAFAVAELAALEIDDGYSPEEVAALREVVEIYRNEFGEQSLEVIAANSQLATAMLWTGDFAGARELHDETITAFEALEPSPTSDWLGLVSNMTTVMIARGNLDRAFTLLHRAFPVARAADNEAVLSSITGQLAEIHNARDEADSLAFYAQQHLDYAQRTYGEGNSQVGYAWRLIGEARHAKGRYEQAADAFAEMRRIQRSDAPMGQLAADALSVAELYVDAGRSEEALALAAASADTLASLFGYDTSLTANARLQRARAWLDLGREAEADTSLRALDEYHQRTRRGPRGHAEALEALGRLHLARGEVDSALATLGRGEEILAERSPEFWKLGRLRGAYGIAQLAAGNREAARPLLESARRLLAGRDDRYEREVTRALAELAD